MSPGQKVSLNLSIHVTGGANSRLEKFQPGKKCTAPLAMVVFTSFIHNYSHYGIHGRSMMLFYMCGIILILSVKEAVDSLRLHGGVSVARKDGGQELYWSQGKTLRDTADNLQNKYPHVLLFMHFIICFREVLNRRVTLLLYMPI